MSQAIFLDCRSEASISGKSPARGSFFVLCFAAATLEVLFVFARLRISLVVIVLLHLSAFFGFVPPNNAATRRSQNCMVASIVARDGADDGALNATLCVS